MTKKKGANKILIITVNIGKSGKKLFLIIPHFIFRKQKTNEITRVTYLYYSVYKRETQFSKVDKLIAGAEWQGHNQDF